MQTTLTTPNVDYATLTAAMKIAVDAGMIPALANGEDYLRRWDAMAQMVSMVQERYTPDRAAILAALTALAQQTDPLLGHGGLLLEVFEALQRGGLDVWELIDCVMAEVGRC